MRPVESLPIGHRTTIDISADGDVLIVKSGKGIFLPRSDFAELVAQYQHADRHGCEACDTGTCDGDDFVCSYCRDAFARNEEAAQ